MLINPTYWMNLDEMPKFDFTPVLSGAEGSYAW